MSSTAAGRIKGARRGGTSSDKAHDLCDSLAARLQVFGFEFFIFSNQQGRCWRSEPWSRIPLQLKVDYFAYHVFERDPVLALALKKRGLCSWQPLVRSNIQDPHDIAGCMAKVGLLSGFSASFVGIAAGCDVISVLSRQAIQLSRSECDSLLMTLSLFWHQQHELEWVEYCRSRQPKLTAREFQVLRWMKEGKSYGDVATITGLSQRVIEFHAKNILTKLDAGDKTTAVVKAIKLGLIAL
jgi:DNA-binding CsgD family transcriptional regulator